VKDKKLGYSSPIFITCVTGLHRDTVVSGGSKGFPASIVANELAMIYLRSKKFRCKCLELLLKESDIFVIEKEDENKQGQSHLLLIGIAANMLCGGWGCRMVSAMVPLDRAFVSSYRLSTVTILLAVTVCPQFAMQILAGGSDVKIGRRKPYGVGDGTVG